MLHSSKTGVYNSTTPGAQLVFSCKTGWSPREQITAQCTTEGRWSPDPADHICEGIYQLQIKSMVVISFVATTIGP